MDRSASSTSIATKLKCACRQITLARLSLEQPGFMASLGILYTILPWSGALSGHLTKKEPVCRRLKLTECSWSVPILEVRFGMQQGPLEGSTRAFGPSTAFACLYKWID